MYRRVAKADFMQAFRDADRYDQFGYDALSALFDFFEDLQYDIGKEIELDVVAFCCDFAVGTQEYIRGAYGLVEDADVVEYLLSNTTLIATLDDGRILYQEF
jgi:hypothetical protein